MKKIAFMLVGLLFHSLALAQTPNWQSVQSVFQTTGETQGNALKIDVPRTDLTVALGTVQLDPNLVASDIVFIQTNVKRSTGLVTADLALLEREVAPVFAFLESKGMEVVALHNHLYGTTPPVLFLHVEGTGSVATLADNIKGALALTASPQTGAPPPATTTPPAAFDPIVSALGPGKLDGTVLEIDIPRREAITNRQVRLPSLAASSAFFFQNLGATIFTTGDIILIPKEVAPVTKALTDRGFIVTAIHNHLIFENPRLIYLHFTKNDTAANIAEGLRAVIRLTNSKRTGTP